MSAVFTTRSKRLCSLKPQDVETGVIVGEVHHALRIDKAVGGLDDLGSIGARVEHALWIGRHEVPGFARLKWILDVKDADAGIVRSREDKARALESARSVLPQIVRPEITALGVVVSLGRDRHRGEAYGVGRLAHIEDPGVTQAQAAIGKIGLVGQHQQIAIGSGSGECVPPPNGGRFVATDLSDYVTGAVIPIDGGLVRG